MGSEARYPIVIESNAAQVAGESASALEQLRAKIEQSKTSIKDYSSSLKDLVGDSEGVTSAKKELIDRINAEKTAITQNQLELLKSGASYNKLTKEHKELFDSKKRLESATKQATSGLKAEIGALDAEKAAAEEATLATLALDAAEDAATAGLGAIIGAAIGATIAVAAAGVEFSKFALTSGNLLRTQQLTREGFVGNAKDAAALGNQIDELASRVTLSRAELNDMATDMAQAGLKGNALVDSLKAVGAESSAVNAKAGDQLKQLLTRGQLTNSFALGAQELQGTGLAFSEVAKNLAKDTKVSVEEASAALQQGRVTLGAGAQAMKEAVEQKFDGLNLKKMLDLNVIAKKFADTLDLLTKDIKLDGLLKGFKELADLFDQGNESGHALKELVTFIGQGLADTFSGATPGMKSFIEELELGALNLQGSYLDLKLQFLETFGPDVLDSVDAFKAGMIAGKTAVEVIAAELKPITASMKEIAILAPAIKEAFSNGLIPTTKKGIIEALLPSHATGLEEVPRDDYVARLHKGERVLTRGEAEAYRRIDSLSSRSGSATNAGAGSGVANNSFSPTIHVTLNASDLPSTNSGGDAIADIKRGVLVALEEFARTRGLAVA